MKAIKNIFLISLNPNIILIIYNNIKYRLFIKIY